MSKSSFRSARKAKEEHAKESVFAAILKKVLSMLRDFATTLFKRRDHGKRALIQLTLIAFLFYIVAVGCFYLNVTYIRRAFEWEDIDAFNEWYAKVSSPSHANPINNY